MTATTTDRPTTPLCRVLQTYALLAHTAQHGTVDEDATVSFAARLLVGKAVERRRVLRVP